MAVVDQTRGDDMYARIVRFTDVDPEHMKNRVENRIEEGGAPEGVTAAGIQVLHDADQRTAVVIQLFDSAEDMSASEAALAGMDPSETPGTRASVDRCEIKVDLRL
jgi:hypothetical protein